MLGSGTRISYHVHQDYNESEGLCIVVDTSSLVNTSAALTALQRIQQRAATAATQSRRCGVDPPHIVVVPYTVVNELEHLSQGESSLLSERAVALLKFFVTCPHWSKRPDAQLVGITRQKKGESNSALDQCARVNDTSIVSCAVYFQGITRRVAQHASGAPGEDAADLDDARREDRAQISEKTKAARRAEERYVGRRLTVLLTEDTIMGVKAAAYDLPVISFSELTACYMRS